MLIAGGEVRMLLVVLGAGGGGDSRRVMKSEA